MSEEQRRAMVEAARRARPLESCAVLIGREEGERRTVEEVVPAANVAEGDRRRRYAIDPRVLLDAHRRARRSGRAVVGYVHSHPADPPVPSERDAVHAWPAASYLIVGRAPGTETASGPHPDPLPRGEGTAARFRARGSLREGGWEVRAWRWSDERGFVEETVEIIDPEA